VPWGECRNIKPIRRARMRRRGCSYRVSITDWPDCSPSAARRINQWVAPSKPVEGSGIEEVLP
jgi:hypothetical protein